MGEQTTEPNIDIIFSNIFSMYDQRQNNTEIEAFTEI